MKKNTKIIIAVSAIIIIILAAVFGGIAIHDKCIIKDAEKNLSVTNTTFELQQSDVTVSIDDVLNTNNVKCTALFSNNAGSIEINASEVKDYTEQITVSLLKPILFNEELKLNVKISIVDTTAPEFTESIEEIKITVGEDINILEHFKATDLSGDVKLSATEFDNNSAGEQTVTVTATDKNNNSSTKEVKIIIESKEDSAIAPSKNNDDKDTKNSGSSKKSNKSGKDSSSGNSSGSSSGGSSGSSSGSSSSNSSSSSEDKKPEVKNVSPKDVQKKVNAYIRSKGITVDSSMTASNASWNGQISGSQKDLNSGWSLKNCKEDVDYIIKNYGEILSMYCYYDGNDFYILYW